MADADRLVAALNYLQEQKPADPLESFRSLAGLRDAYERRVQPIINNARQTFSTGGAIGDLLRSYGDAAAPGNAAALQGMGIPFKGPMTAPREEGFSSGENFRPMGDPQQQFAGQLLGDPMNVQPMVAPAARGAVAAGKYAGPKLARGLENYMGKVGMRPSIMELWHGSPENIPEVTNSGIFGGVFAHPERSVALSHADNLHKFNIPEEKILTQDALSNISKSEFMRLLSIKEKNKVDRLRELVVYGEFPNEADLKLLKSTDLGEASWEAQRLRGVIARKQGFHAVAMPDEHGTSYLVLPPAKIIKSAPQDEALRLAQQRAALPVEQHGLGLPADNTPQQRAAAMDFEMGWAHGSPNPDIAKMRGSTIGAEGPGAYATNYLPEASTYAQAESGATNYPLAIRNADTLQAGSANPYDLLGATDDAQLAAKLSAAGRDSIQATQQQTPQWLLNAGAPMLPVRSHYVSQNPDNFRSRFAAFDPWRRNSALAAALGVAAPDLLAQENK